MALSQDEELGLEVFLVVLERGCTLPVEPVALTSRLGRALLTQVCEEVYGNFERIAVHSLIVAIACDLVLNVTHEHAFSATHYTLLERRLALFAQSRQSLTHQVVPINVVKEAIQQHCKHSVG